MSEMIVTGTSKEDDLRILCKGSLEECKQYCRSIKPAEWDSVNICEDNGVIRHRIVLGGFYFEWIAEGVI